ncbi:MAG: ABC transporter ATP-binding protein [Candidatus Hadarchaeota archaeon]
MIVLKNVVSGYTELPVIKNISLEVEEKNLALFLGANGVGKTTLLRTVYRFLPLFDGEIHFNGENIENVNPWQLANKGMSYVPAEENFYPTLSVVENLQTASTIAKENYDSNLEKVFDLFPRLEERQEQRAGTLSGGEKQMLAISCSFMQEPDLLLLDEPSQNLAPKLVKEVFEKIKEIKRTGVTIMLAEQKAPKNLDMIDRIVILRDGKVAVDNKDRDLSQKKIIKEYFG